MGFLAVSVLSSLKIFAEFEKKRPRLLFYRNGFKIFIRMNDITEKLLQNAVEWRSFELHSMLQCGGIEQEIHPPMWAFNRVHTCAYLALHWNNLWGSNKRHSTYFEMGFLAVSVSSGLKFLASLINTKASFFLSKWLQFYFTYSPGLSVTCEKLHRTIGDLQCQAFKGSFSSNSTILCSNC